MGKLCKLSAILMLFYGIFGNNHAASQSSAIEMEILPAYPMWSAERGGRITDYGTPPDVGMGIIVPEDHPYRGRSVDIYYGIYRPDGSGISWVTGGAEFQSGYLDAKVVNGYAPIATNIKLQGLISDRTFGYERIYKQYKFTENDVAGLYIYFILVVEHGKSPGDPSNWMASRTRIYPVKP